MPKGPHFPKDPHLSTNACYCADNALQFNSKWPAAHWMEQHSSPSNPYRYCIGPKVAVNVEWCDGWRAGRGRLSGTRF